MTDQEIRGKIIQVLHDRRKLAEGNWVRLNELDFSGGEQVSANSIAEALRYLAYYVEWEAPASISGINLGRARLRNPGTDLAEGNIPPPVSIVMPAQNTVNLEARSQTTSSASAALGVVAKARAAGEVDAPPFIQNEDSASQIAIDNFRKRDRVATTETFGPTGSGPIGAGPIAGGTESTPQPTAGTAPFSVSLDTAGQFPPPNLSRGFVVFANGIGQTPDLAHAEILRRLESIEKKLDERPAIFPGRGHNNPPEAIFDYTDSRGLKDLFNQIKDAPPAPPPPEAIRRDWAERLDDYSDKIFDYTAKLFDAAAVEAAKKVGGTLAGVGLATLGIGAAGIYAISYLNEIARELAELAYLLTTWGVMM